MYPIQLLTWIRTIHFVSVLLMYNTLFEYSESSKQVLDRKCLEEKQTNKVKKKAQWGDGP